MSSETEKFTSVFEKDVYTGLTSFPKYLLSKYIYDKQGDALFRQIMEMPEYYLTRAEFGILEANAEQIAGGFSDKGAFDLIELGAGDGKKTRILLKALLKSKADFNYMPVDISQNALDQLESALTSEFPGMAVAPRQGMYFKVLHELASYNRRKKVIMVLGSNIGNLKHPRAIAFLKNIAELMSPDDLLFMGFDQKKDPAVILEAYNDAAGITAAFNKNILTRINRELQADFDTDQFLHWETYNPETGTASSYLVAKKAMSVTIKKLGLSIDLAAWETIHTEISQKYDDATVSWLAGKAGLSIQEVYTNSRQGYKNYIFSVKN